MAELRFKGYRVLGVASGIASDLRLAGLIALGDPPRPDSVDLVGRLDDLGVGMIMVTGDARRTTEVVAAAIGITGPVFATTPIPAALQADRYAVFAGVLPEDKFRLV